MRELLVGALAAGALAAAGVARAKYVARTRGRFEPTRYVWSRGLALLCDKNGGVDFVKKQLGGRAAMRFDPAAYAGIRDGDLVWVRHIALPQFVAEVLPHARARFGLVTGDEDWSIPSMFAGSQVILDDPHVGHWFTQNHDGTDRSGKVSGIPIGLDFHTISNRRKWGHWPMTPAEQEAQLAALVARMPPPAERALRVHADFNLNQHKKQAFGEPRPVVEAQLRKNPCVDFQEHRVRRELLWETKTRYAFVASPHGNGLDCHRTWESLVLGNIVIVKRSPLDPLYDQLPVVILDDWGEITADNLRRWRDQHGAAFARPEMQERLTGRWWIEHMRRRLAG